MENKDIKYCRQKDIKYCRQVLLHQCADRVFSNNRLIHPDFSFTDNEHDESEESEEEIN